ncbi:MAG: aminopeptidase P family protein [Nitrososphaerota archaeon]|nr:aminopeptidase P family protein [Nitrososphaerota archaeon]MDG6939135.1 aminopeptidase P family protein [Nitrososphaerota archaeon]
MRPGVLDRVRGRLRERGLDGFVHFQTSRARENVVLHYLSGVMRLEDSGILVPVDSDPVLFVKDFEGERAARMGRIGDTRALATVPLDSAMRGVGEILREKGLEGRRLGIDDSELSVEVFLELQKLGLELVPFGSEIREMMTIKAPEEVASIRRAVGLASAALGRVRELAASGMSEHELAAEASLVMERGGGEKSFVHVQYDRNASFPHHDSDGTRVEGDGLLVVDLGARVDGYTSDLTRTFAVGSPKGERVKIMEAARDALEAAIEAVRPGAAVADVAKAARDVLRSRGLPGPKHRIGHGVGLGVHERPIVEEGFPGRLAEGMVLAIEPGVYIPGVTGCRLESNVLVTADGHEALDEL